MTWRQKGKKRDSTSCALPEYPHTHLISKGDPHTISNQLEAPYIIEGDKAKFVPIIKIPKASMKPICNKLNTHNLQFPAQTNLDLTAWTHLGPYG